MGHAGRAVAVDCTSAARQRPGRAGPRRRHAISHSRSPTEAGGRARRPRSHAPSPGFLRLAAAAGPGRKHTGQSAGRGENLHSQETFRARQPGSRGGRFGSDSHAGSTAFQTGCSWRCGDGVASKQSVSEKNGHGNFEWKDLTKSGFYLYQSCGWCSVDQFKPSRRLEG